MRRLVNTSETHDVMYENFCFTKCRNIDCAIGIDIFLVEIDFGESTQYVGCVVLSIVVLPRF